MRDAFAEIKEIREAEFRVVKQSVARIGPMQNGSADADDTPGARREHQESDHIDPKALVYVRFGLATRLDIGVCENDIFLLAQVVTPFGK